MKQAHSTKWRRSVQPRKQRKYIHNLPDHLLGSQLHAHLAEPLRKKYGVRAVRIRVGDKVRVLRGTHKTKEGKVERVDPREARIFVSKVEVSKKQGGNAPHPLKASNLLILELAEEKRRFKHSSQPQKSTQPITEPKKEITAERKEDSTPGPEEKNSSSSSTPKKSSNQKEPEEAPTKQTRPNKE